MLIVGAGGLGTPAATYLAAAGVGTLGVVDDDVVDLTNLQRQILYDTQSVGRPKTEVASERLRALNPDVKIVALQQRLTSENALGLFEMFDVVVDGTDNFATRYLINDACVLTGRPYVYASVLRFEGQASVFARGSGPCYRCLFPTPPPQDSVPNCADAGVLGVLPGLLGVIQATEALKLLLGIGETLEGRLLIVDALRMQFRTMKIGRNNDCIACGTRELQQLQDYDRWCNPAVSEGAVRQIEPTALQARMKTGPIDIIDVREAWEWGICHIEGARLIPLSMLEDLASTIDPNRDTVLYCHHGARSQAAAERLAMGGHHRLFNLAGGIERWRLDVDPAMRRY